MSTSGWDDVFELALDHEFFLMRNWRPPRRDRLGVLSLCALVALALNLRSPLTAIPPVVGEIRAALDIGPAVAGLLTSIPVLCFGLLAPLASLIIARIGIERAIITTLIGAAVGLVARPYTGLGGMLGGTLLIGASLAIGNIVSLMVIARDFPDRRNVVTGLYTAALNVGTMLTGALTAPIAAVTGWQFALASWVWMAVAAILLWAWMEHVQRAAGSAAPIGPLPRSGARLPAQSSLYRRPIVWALAGALTLHLFIYYGITAWLPAYLIEAAGMDATRAGLAASTFQVLSLLGSFGVPILARQVPLGRQMIVMGALWMSTPLWMLAAPHQWPLWALVGGIAQGGTFVVIFMLIMQHAASLDDNRRLSMVVQGVAYTFSSFGPIVVALAHEASVNWRAPFLLLAGLSLVLAAIGVAVGRIAPPKQTFAETRP